jgi:hypothetical protein
MAFELEKYRGMKSRYTCPACNARNEFTRFINTETGEHLPEQVGICNRSSKCGYRYTAKQFFADNPMAHTGRGEQSTKCKKRNTSNYGFADKNGFTAKHQAGNLSNESKEFDYIPFESFKATLGNYEQNAFVQFLINLFPDCAEEIQAVLEMYLIGTYEDFRGNYTCFPSVDCARRICRAKLIRFDEKTGKRHKGDYDTSSLPAKLKLKEDFQYKQIFFGEHLLPKYPNKQVAIVEAEKTAIIASLCIPEFVWLACNSKTWLKAERIKRLGNRQIIIYPDADGFNLWQQIATDARKQGLPVKVSSLIEIHATDEQKANGYDLADYLINQQAEINQTNDFIDRYNAKLETVLSDERLKRDFETILDEQKTVAIYNGLSEVEAERKCTHPENIRAVVLSV